jgi:hypothetical protein
MVANPRKNVDLTARLKALQATNTDILEIALFGKTEIPSIWVKTTGLQQIAGWLFNSGFSVLEHMSFAGLTADIFVMSYFLFLPQGAYERAASGVRGAKAADSSDHTGQLDGLDKDLWLTLSHHQLVLRTQLGELPARLPSLREIWKSAVLLETEVSLDGLVTFDPEGLSANHV